ncbi:cold shock and DUF1294 domain-containing protein [Gimesia sp.]|uniref:cold shock and DUF1294 domain-containing protein n=1 Tax=Gimesia sp. TaxID=2024833 RepID=UPI000C3BAFC0|nr:cold shock and DUF1294 domain-containing protein [Gimesia sp.]MAX35028.1 DNA-binding protein [Gimesia sp.]HAH49714.1 DUF1294 domain-containing protein [Planctomycetaceae bacterium]|tara:strand:- start:166 stop:798 length:633 start_codon:yes stop_codon:yes gene_type:complete
MRLQGKITRWDDEKGFGFISSQDDENTVFVHISAFSHTARRPEAGDPVSYETAHEENGKTRAEKVRFADQSVGKRLRSAPAVSFTVMFVGFLLVSVYFNRISWLVLIVYFVASCITFFAYAWDKSAAQRGKWRTAESTLHFMALAGGWPGALAAQRLLRHKSSKHNFLLVYWITVFLNVAVVGYLVWSGDAGFLNQLINAFWQNASHAVN